MLLALGASFEIVYTTSGFNSALPRCHHQRFMAVGSFNSTRFKPCLAKPWVGSAREDFWDWGEGEGGLEIKLARDRNCFKNA